MITKESIFESHLKTKGLKLTPQRKAILEEVFASHEHFDIEELFANLRNKGKRISRATIYRTLPLLVESNLIKEAFRYQDKVSYEHIFGHGHHDHLLCIKCGRIIEFMDEKIEELQEAVCKKYGFKPTEHRLGIKGYCKKCISHE
ncbi:MAG: transcriptional repressor [Deltaproteobacteria bacterium]|nr:MAG: transcriptional repressor [Deltaproteobacteria bacterium]